MPAQPTSPCRPPYAATAAATAAVALASSATSVFTKRAARPSSAASACPSASFRSAMTALPPPATIMRTVAAPRPDAPPVTMNVLPLSSMSVSAPLGRFVVHGVRQHACALPSRITRVWRHHRAVRHFSALTTLMAVAISPAMSDTLDGTISVLLVRASRPNALM